MRRFFLLTSAIILIGSSLLLGVFGYSIITVIYHLLLMILGQSLFFCVLYLLRKWITHSKIYVTIVQILCFIYLTAIVCLYLLILSSNFFWKKTVSITIIKNYFLKVGSFVSSLPVEPWIFYTASLIIFSLITGAFLFTRPRKSYLYSIDRQPNSTIKLKQLVFVALSLIIVVSLRSQLLRVKRLAQFAEEPVLGFVFGNMWGKGNETAFEKRRYLLGELDKACLDSLTLKPLADNRSFVVIVVDALRSDHLSIYGYDRNTTPFLDSLHKANRLLAVKAAFSSSTNTVGGVAGLFYSRDWEDFGYNGLNIMSYLKKVEYKTYAYLTGYHRDWFGLSALYRSSSDVYYESPKDPDIPPDDDMVTLNKLMNESFTKRSFTYIHLLSTHTIGRKHIAFQKFIPAKVGIGVDGKTALINNYDNGILQADYVIRNIFNKLKADGLLDQTTVFITADHGELFGEDGGWSHGGNVHPKLITVPFLIYDQQPEWYNNLEAMSLKDVAPTVVQRLGYRVPACWTGTSLHFPPHDFTLKINSVSECLLPYGSLEKRLDTLRLFIKDDKGVVQKKLAFKNYEWQNENGN